jgi:hypothetical protein
MHNYAQYIAGLILEFKSEISYEVGLNYQLIDKKFRSVLKYIYMLNLHHPLVGIIC